MRTGAVLLVSRYALRFSLRTGGGVVTLVLVLAVGLSVGAFFVTPVERMLQQNPAFAPGGQTSQEALEEAFTSDQALQALHGTITMVTGADQDQADFMIFERPALLSAIFVILLILMPFVACIGAFNQTASDIGSRGLRYLLLRTERPNIFLGRFVGTLVFSTISVLIVSVVIALYIGLKVRIYPGGQLAGWGLEGSAALFFVILPHIALCSWVSARCDAAFASLAFCLLLVGFPLVIVSVLASVFPGNADWLIKILPWGWKYDLLSHDLGQRLLAYGVMTAFTTVFLLGGLRTFQRRDL